MARSTKRSPQVEEVRSYVEGVAKNLVDKLYGPKGPPWGTKLADIEDVLLDLRALLTEKMLDLTLAQQAAAHDDRPAPFRDCPTCQQPLACHEANVRLLRTRAGDTVWSEPEGFCTRCRRAFFPSVPKSGD